MERINSFIAALLAAVMLAITVIFAAETDKMRDIRYEIPDYIDIQLIDIDGEARSGKTLETVRNIVVHYTGNPGASAGECLKLCNENENRAAPHFIIGLEGEIIQCIPLEERASASGERNCDSISIEVCHPDESGEFTEESCNALVKLTAWLCETCGLTENNVIRHYDVTGMECPLYFVVHENAWNEFKEAVRERIK